MSDRSKRERQRDIFDALHSRGLFEFGAVITTETVHEIMGVEMPDVAPKSVYDRIAMMELQAIDYCRNILLGQGKYLAGTPSGYRVLLPSENKTQIDAYIESADRKLARALKLSRNTPTESLQPDQTEARIMMRRNGVRRNRIAEQVAA